MGPKYLIDTNIVINALKQQLPPKAAQFVQLLPPIISQITRIELLGWPRATSVQLVPLQFFIKNAVLLAVDEPVIKQTIQLRQHHKIKLGDALIAATALVHGIGLVTQNVSDFKLIRQLKVIDPYSL